jgi:hypothetical protein
MGGGVWGGNGPECSMSSRVNVIYTNRKLVISYVL